MYEALNERRHTAGLPDYQGHMGLHSKEFQQRRWLHGNLLPLTYEATQVVFRIDRWEAEPAVMSYIDNADEEDAMPGGHREQWFVPLTWEIC